MHPTGQEGTMLRESYYTPPTPLDEQIFAALVPEQH